MVGRAATILCKVDMKNRSKRKIKKRTAGLVILPSCIGTLKSTRIRTLLSLRSTSVMESLLESDILDDERDRLVCPN